MEATYSEQKIGGIGYRLDMIGTEGGRRFNIAYTTNPDGSGLFFHNGHGGRQQIRGNGQFSAHSMRQFKAKTASILAARQEYADR